MKLVNVAVGLVVWTVVAMTVVIGLSGCATFEKNAYTSLSAARTTYTQSMLAIQDLQRQGKLTQADAKKIYPVAAAYYNAYLSSVAAFEVYRKTKSTADQDKLITALTEASLKLAALIPLLAPFNVTVQPLAVPIKK